MLLSVLRDITWGYINWLLGGIVIVNLTFILGKYSPKKCLIVLSCMMLFLFSFIYSKDIGQNIKDFLNWLSCLEIILVLCDEKIVSKILDACRYEYKFIRRILYLYTLEITILLLMPSCYASYWGGVVFKAFTVPIGAASNACLYLLMSAWVIGYDRKYFSNVIKKDYVLLIGCFLNLFVIVKSQVRALLFGLLAIMGMILIVIFKKKITKIVVAIFGGITFASFMLKSKSFMSKMQYSFNQMNIAGFSFLDAMLSSRPIIWKNDLKYFIAEGNTLNYLCGKGFDYAYRINLKCSGGYFWAHSDIVQTVTSLGIIGLFIFYYYIYKFIKVRAGHSKYIMLMIIIYLVFPSVLNGIILTPTYCYSLIFYAFIIKEIREIQLRKVYLWERK